MSAHDDEFNTAGTDKFDVGKFSTSSDDPTSALSLDREPTVGKDKRATAWHAGLDVGLLVLRLVLGSTLFAHGLQKVFGWFGGPGIDGFAKALDGFGYTGYTTVLSWITGLTELGGGALLVLGLFTPIGATAALGLAVNIVYVKFGSGFFTGPMKGFEFELLLAAVAFALLFTGAGRISLDVNTPWRRKPLPLAIVGLVLAAAASIAVLVLFH